MNRKQFKKNCRKSVNALLVYNMLTYVVILFSIVAHVVMAKIRGVNLDLLIEDDAYWEQLGESGIEYLIIVFIGFLMIAIFQKWLGSWKEIVRKEKAMDKITLFKLCVVFMMPQFLGSIFDYCGESVLNYFGYTMEMSVEAATSGSESMWMLLYAGILGPITEELWFRGVILKSAMPYGKRFAIVVSSILFGVFHGNIPQGIFASVIGLVLAYVAVEYSILWSIALHIFNNLIMCEGTNYLIQNLPISTQDIICNLLMFLFFLGGIAILWHDRKKIKEYLAQNPKSQKKHYTWYFTMTSTLIFLLTNLAISLLGITKL